MRCFIVFTGGDTSRFCLAFMPFSILSLAFVMVFFISELSVECSAILSLNNSVDVDFTPRFCWCNWPSNILKVSLTEDICCTKVKFFKHLIASCEAEVAVVEA